ncbi:MAG: M61 family metallopeptidase [Bernardetiaceae bacterium]|nr:M61 family metallopeptidase [Bernardetiaceae bacterium]
MQYLISYQDTHSKFLHFNLQIDNIAQAQLELQLPAWRPGRYSLQNFAKNIRDFAVYNAQSEPLAFRKISKDRWQIDTEGIESIIVKYEYYASQQDAGGCWIDDSELYLNFICCGLAVIGREEEAYKITLDIPESYQIACALPQEGKTLLADNFFHLVDSPLIAAAHLQHQTYNCQGTTCQFHIWISGDFKPNWAEMLHDFQRFSQVQVDMFGGLEAQDYHFMFRILPFRLRHGVEHSFSTVIVMGPDYAFYQQSAYRDLLAISSHELFHYWNIMRIRPIEMSPYQLERENYFRTGFVAEGLTTYYGDYLLRQSAVFGLNDYLKSLEGDLQRHLDNFGRLRRSVAESSYDLWLDGYEMGIPHRKSSIYIEGLVAALILDLTLREESQGERSLNDVMRKLWEDFGKKQIGYSEADYKQSVEQIAQRNMDDYFARCIYGSKDLLPLLRDKLLAFGIELRDYPHPSTAAARLGFKTQLLPTATFPQVLAIMPGSPADSVFAQGDEIAAINGKKVENETSLDMLLDASETLHIHYFRNSQLREVKLRKDEHIYYKNYQLYLQTRLSKSQTLLRDTWLRAVDASY